MSPAEIVLKMVEMYVTGKESGFFGANAEKVYENNKAAGTVVRLFSSIFGFAFIAYMNKSETSFTEKIEVVTHVNLEMFDFTRSIS